MITKNQAKKIKDILGHRYTSVILKYLEENNIKNSKGMPYTSESIRVVMNGFSPNERLEVQIYNAVFYYKLKKKEEEKRRKEILAKTNSKIKDKK
jgi:hypothetical protein